MASRRVRSSGVVATQYLAHSSDCLEAVELELASPLGSRSILDLSTGQTVEDVARLD